jgi:hypothetical protein
MAHENFKIRIRRDGIVEFITRDDMTEARVRELREMLEDALGPIREIQASDGDDLPPPGVAIAEEEAQEEIRKRAED